MSQQQPAANAQAKKGGNDFSYGVNKANMETFSRKELLVLLNSGVLQADMKAKDQKSSLTVNEKTHYTLQLPFCNLSELDLRHLNLERCNFFASSLDKIKLDESNVQSACLENCFLQGASLVNTDLRKANLKNADLRGANLENADLQFVSLAGARLDGANLKNVNLQFANLGGCNWRDASCLDGVNVKNTYGDIVPTSNQL